MWSVASAALLRLANIALTAAIARILSPRDFGVFAVALTAYSIVSSLGEFGVSSCLSRADLDVDFLAPTVVATSLISSVAMAACMAIFAKPIAVALGSASAANSVRVMALAVVLVGIFAVPSAQLARDFKQDKVFLSNVIGFIASTATLVAMATSGSGALAFAWSRVVGQLAVGCVMLVWAGKYYWPALARKALSVILRYGLPMAGANFVNYILLNVDYALVGRLMGAVMLGIYVLAFNVASWPASLLGSMINSIGVPTFSRVKHDSQLLKDTVGESLRGVALIVAPMCALIMALARPLILTLYGTHWFLSASVLSALSVYGGISIICLLFANVLAGMGKTRFLLIIQLVWLMALGPAMAVGVRRDGIVGAALAHIAVIVPLVLPSYVIALRRVGGIGVGMLVKAVLPALLAAAAAAACARAVIMLFSSPVTQLLCGLVVGTATYILLASAALIDLLVLHRAPGRRMGNFLRSYNAVVKSVGLPGVNISKHAMRTKRSGLLGGVAPASASLGARIFAAPLTDPVRSDATALALLIEISKLQARAPAAAKEHDGVGAMRRHADRPTSASFGGGRRARYGVGGIYHSRHSRSGEMRE